MLNCGKFSSMLEISRIFNLHHKMGIRPFLVISSFLPSDTSENNEEIICLSPGNLQYYVLNINWLIAISN